MTSGEWFFYIVRCNDDSLYSGISNRLDTRITKHNSGKGARYTASRRPVTLVYKEPCASHPEARAREIQIKSWSKAKKEQLVGNHLLALQRGETDMEKSKPKQRPFTRERYPMPDFFLKALKKHKLLAAYEARPPYQRNDYIGWITRARLEATQAKRLNQMLAELKSGREYMGMAYKSAK
jgi:predicted GIY-YIG superfamily endonuclease